MTTDPTTHQNRYLEPGWFTRNVFNRVVRRLTLLGVSVMGSRELRVRGRSTGEWRATRARSASVTRITPSASGCTYRRATPCA